MTDRSESNLIFFQKRLVDITPACSASPTQSLNLLTFILSFFFFKFTFLIVKKFQPVFLCCLPSQDHIIVPHKYCNLKVLYSYILMFSSLHSISEWLNARISKHCVILDAEDFLTLFIMTWKLIFFLICVHKLSISISCRKINWSG